MADKRITLRLALQPVDTLFFRDARPPSPSVHADSGLPSPQTLAGAIRTLLLKAHGVSLRRFGERVRKAGSFDRALAKYGNPVAELRHLKISGPWISWKGEVLVPVPSSLKITKSGAPLGRSIIRMDPRRMRPPGWSPPEGGMLPLWHHGRETVESVSGFLAPAGLRAFLEGGMPSPRQIHTRETLFEIDRRVGIAVDPRRMTAAESMIYTAGMLALRPEAAFCAEITGGDELIEPLRQSGTVMKFGGEGRYVELKTHREPFWSNMPVSGADGRLVLLTTPAWFDGWKPRKMKCIAASVSHGQGVSGWDLARGGPKPNRFMVPAGTVYYLPKNSHIPRTLVEREDALVGWGHYLEGNWSYV
ncbi:MAG: type III-B CRISPR module-associated protein Cmr3 [Bacteroidota bacterium]|nr:type III-B CRISPR module-associated protein Cmr3 [Bacteroidota bacterium]